MKLHQIKEQTDRAKEVGQKLLASFHEDDFVAARDMKEREPVISSIIREEGDFYEELFNDALGG